MATAKKLPSGSWRCLVFSHYENLFNEDVSPMIDEKTGKQKRKRIYESFTSDLQGRRGKRDAEAQAAQFLAEKDRKKRPENWTVKEAFENYIKLKDHVLSETTSVAMRRSPGIRSDRYQISASVSSRRKTCRAGLTFCR